MAPALVDLTLSPSPEPDEDVQKSGYIALQAFQPRKQVGDLAKAPCRPEDVRNQHDGAHAGSNADWAKWMDTTGGAARPVFQSANGDIRQQSQSGSELRPFKRPRLEPSTERSSSTSSSKVNQFATAKENHNKESHSKGTQQASTLPNLSGPLEGQSDLGRSSLEWKTSTSSVTPATEQASVREIRPFMRPPQPRRTEPNNGLRPFRGPSKSAPQETSGHSEGATLVRANSSADSLQRSAVKGAPAAPSKGVNPYTAEEDALLIKLKEIDQLPWGIIAKYFDNRNSGSLQVHYSSKLRSRGALVQRVSTMTKSKAHSTDQETTTDAEDDRARSRTPRKKRNTHFTEQETITDAEEDRARSRPQRKKRNNGTSAAAGFVSWADVKKARARSKDAAGSIEDQNKHQSERKIQKAPRRAAPPSRPLSQLLRRREMGASYSRGGAGNSRSIPMEFRERVFDDVGPSTYFKGTSGDVTTLAWSGDGNKFAAGSVAISDDRSMQYNRPGNLILGDHDKCALRELDGHHVARPEVGTGYGNANGLHSMRETQDPRLFMTVASVQFSPDSRTMYSAGGDRKVRAYGLQRDSDEAELLYDLDHQAPLDLMSISNTGLVATGCRQAADGSIGVYDGQQRKLSLSPSGKDRQIERAIFPSSLKWGVAPQHTNLLLAGFAIGATDDERLMAGETCLWDVRGEARIEVRPVTRNVFDVAWNPLVSLTSIVFAVASTPGHNKVNKGMRSVVQCFAPDQGKASSVLEWECPAFDINDVVFNQHDDNVVAAGATDRKVYVWDKRFIRNSSSPLLELGHGDTLSVLDHDRDPELSDDGVRFLSWGATSSRLYSGSSDGVVKVWDPRRSLADAHVKDTADFSSAIMSGAFSPDYRDLLIGEDQGRINLLSVGNESRAVRSMQRFEFHAAPAPVPEKEDPSSDLLRSGQIELRPMGALPVRQAVQGLNYNGPFAKPSAQEWEDAEQNYQRALNEQNTLHSRASKASTQPNEADQTLRASDQVVEEAQHTLLSYQSRHDHFNRLQHQAQQTQLAFLQSAHDHQHLLTALPDPHLTPCSLPCSHLPSGNNDDKAAPDSNRSASRIPTSLWPNRNPSPSTLPLLSIDELLEAGLTRQCLNGACRAPAPTPSKPGQLPVCEACSLRRRGLTGKCARCKEPVRAAGEGDERVLCEKCCFACFRCGGVADVAGDGREVACGGCGLVWEAGVLGYEVTRDAGRMGHKGRKRRAETREQIWDLDEVDETGESEFGAEEMERHSRLWGTT